MKFQQWPKRDPRKNYFLVPNEVFHIGLSHPEISIYCYLLSIENRETYQCWPSYKTIGKALGMCENTVSKYVRSLEEKDLIRTEPTMIRSKDGRPLNGNLLYTIRPIQAAMESFYERQFRQLDEDAARQRAAERLAESTRRSPQNALCAPLGEGAGGEYPLGFGGRIWAAFGGVSRTASRIASGGGGKCGDEGESRIKPWRRKRRPGNHVCPQCGQFRGAKAGVFDGRKKGRWRQLSHKAPCCRLFADVCLDERRVFMGNETKERLPLRMKPETSRRLEQWYAADNCRSKNEFVEKAVNFYVDYLEMRDDRSLLPTALLAVLDGRLGRLEDLIARREYTREVELDMVIGIIADAMEIDRDDLKRRRAESVRNVKATNGLISLEKRARAAEEPNWDGDPWQD